MKYKKYKKEFDYTYVFGSFAVLNAINSHANEIVEVYSHEKLSQNSLEIIEKACLDNKITFIQGANKQVERVRLRESDFVFAIIKKYSDEIEDNQNHIVLDRPSDMGNLGTIIRTALGFNYKNIVIIGDSADYFNPKTIRSSMGAVFDVNVKKFKTYKDYQNYCKIDREIFCFMLGAKTELREIDSRISKPISLVFGNESSGLDESYKNVGRSVYIKNSEKIDSLNLSIAASIAMYHFFLDI